MPKVLVSAVVKQKNVISAQVTGFTVARFAFGNSQGDSSTANMRLYHETISYATDVRSTQTDMNTTARMVQGAGGFSKTHVYLLKGYLGPASTLSSTVNKIESSTDTQSSPTITFSEERRGPFYSCPVFLNRIYFIGGYRDIATVGYKSKSTYVDTSTDTATDTTDFLIPAHFGASLYTKSFAYLFKGFTTSDVQISSYYRWSFATDTASSLGTEGGANYGICGISADIFGYLVGGFNTRTATKIFNYNTQTFSTGNTLPSGVSLSDSLGFAYNTKGYCWTGYRFDTTTRNLLNISWATGSISNASYILSSPIASNGWIHQGGGA